MKIRHLVTTRFLYFDFFKDGRIFKDGYRNAASKVLMHNFINTVKNQTDIDHECIIITHENNLEYTKSLKFPIEAKIFTYDDIILNIKESLKEYDYIIHTTSDYDDFFHKDNLDIIKKSLNSDTKFKMFGFTNGVTLVDGEKEPHRYNPSYLGTKGFFSCCSSIIYSTKIKFTEDFPFIIHDVAKKYNGRHAEWKNIIEKEYINWGLDKLDHDFFDYDENDTSIRFIWIRQPLSYTTIKLMNDNRNQHLSEEIIKLDLKNDFGYENE